ncbi:hypothetical protein NNJEOMEG_03271 [Fundidesulfovibrio magnetotacticus]|uniref:Glycosyltransferase n=1 Tax=Fundidesulfovibrio magnetotacticus TaxID=2730080 RepID=A0A6V8LYV0_9BACT|nr:glycosyltransferase family 1 protein [Fundidesulfovibrio magnetotacticus]GFK95408.1 hypothetical protein NNJEOMEG_03271 [Fundidesulfovibrio magnetotacticus]
MKVLHFSLTPLAGMPVRLVQALNRHTRVQARLADRSRFGRYDHDLVMDEDPEAVLQAARDADILHLHNYLDLDSDRFAPLDFRALQRAGKRVVRQFHTEPGFVARTMGITPEALLAQDIPALVIAQHPERLYRKAYVAPNFIPESRAEYAPCAEPTRWDVFYNPTMNAGAWEDRWNTKGTPQVLPLLRSLEAEGWRVRRVTHIRPLAEALPEKRSSRICLDDLVTGSYHLTGLEALAMGVCAVNFLDERSQTLIRHFSGASGHPYVNARLEEAPAVLRRLLADPDLTRELGLRGRRWLLDHWSEARMIGHYVRAYELLLEDPALLTRQPELSLEGRAAHFLFKELPDLAYKTRADAWDPSGDTPA